jgi:hypothetical protein
VPSATPLRFSLVQHCKLLFAHIFQFKIFLFQASFFNLLLVCTRLVSKRRYPTRIRLRKVLSSYKRKEGVPSLGKRGMPVKCQNDCRMPDRMPDRMLNQPWNRMLECSRTSSKVRKCHRFGSECDDNQIGRKGVPLLGPKGR